MERLTKPGHEYYSCDFMDDGVYIGMNRLREYEDTGLTPEQIIEMDKMYTELAKEVMQLRQKGTALALENIKCAKKKEGYLSFGTCPKCKRRVSNVEGGNYCQNCGQRLKWED